MYHMILYTEILIYVYIRKYTLYISKNGKYNVSF